MSSAWLFALALGCAPPAEDRVAIARQRSSSILANLYRQANLLNPPAEIYFRAYKQEKQLELWAAAKKGQRMVRIHTWTVAAASGKLGPKRTEGDRQVPEGFYTIDRFNPKSNFWLSLGINYPNASDRLRSDPKKPGGDIFIHGNQVSIGCLAMTDPVIDLVYLAALPFGTGTRVDILPARDLTLLQRQFKSEPALVSFWKELAAVDNFAKTGRPPKFRVGNDGAYRAN